MVTGLPVGWGGIVDVGANSIVGKMGAECVAVLDPHHILMPNLFHVLKDDRSLDTWIVDGFVIGSGDSGARLVFLFQVAQFHPEHSSLDFVQAAVISLINIVVASVGTVIGQCPNGCGKGVIVGDYSSTVAQGTQVLGRVEADTCRVTQSARDERAVQAGYAAVGANRLGVILYNAQVVVAGRLHQCHVPTGSAIEVHWHDGAGARCDKSLKQAGVEVHGVNAGVAQHGHQAALADGENAGDIGVGGHDNLIALTHDSHFLVGLQDKPQGVEAVAHPHAVPCLAQGRNFLL